MTALTSKASNDRPYHHGTLREAMLEAAELGSSRVDLQACKLEYSIVSPK